MLNVGCGNAYKPGAVNIDFNKACAADMIADVRKLPFVSGSVDAVEADQLLEHFDTAHVRIVLDELHRVLRDNGMLTIETPDVRKAARRLASRKLSRINAELQWVYGMDSPGLEHKTGFTKDSLSKTLDESAFDVVCFDEPRTHTYEPGLRVICRRRKRASARDRAAARALRSVAFDRVLGDSFTLLPLEEELTRLCRCSDGGDTGLLARLCVVNPMVARAMDTALREEGIMLEDGVTGFIEELARAGFHERAFTLWKKSVRRGGSRKEFEEFVNRLAKDVKACLVSGHAGADGLGYVLSLGPTPIPLMEHRLAMVQGQRAAGTGIRMYTLGRHEDAIEHLTEALSINPSDFLTAMNLARLRANHGSNPIEIRETYARAIECAPTSLRDAAEREMAEYLRTGFSPDNPFTAL